MSYNISTSSTPQFSPVSDSASIQDWSFDPGTLIQRFYLPGAALPAQVALNVSVKDYPTLFANDTTYSQFLVKVSVLSFDASFLGTPTTSIAPTGSDLANTLDYTYSIPFADLELLLPNADGFFSASIRFQVFGVQASNGIEVLLDTQSVLVKLNYVVTDHIFVVPDNLSFVHITDTTLPAAQDLEVYAAQDFNIKLHKDFDLVGYDPVNATDLGDSYLWNITADATSITTLQVRPNINIESNENQPISLPEGLIVSNATQSAAVALSYFVSPDGLTHISPNVLSFFSIIGLENAEAQILQVFSPYTVSITAPSWLSLSTTSITNIGQVAVQPIIGENFLPGIYTDVITFTANGVDYLVNVMLEVVQNIQLNLNLEGFNFTDNNEAFTQIFSPDNTNQLQLKVSMSQIGYAVTFAPDESFDYLTGFFNNRTKIHLGKIVKRTLYKMTKADFKSLLTAYLDMPFLSNYAFDYYTPTSVKLELSEIDGNGVVQQTNETFSNIRFALGRPPLVVDGFAFLNAKPIRQRVFKSSVVLLNYLTAAPVVFSCYKNDNLHFTTNQAFTGLKARGLYQKFNTYKIGDVIKFTAAYLPTSGFAPTPVDGPGESFIVYQDGKHFNSIAYYDEYGCVRFFDFSGDWSIQSEYNFIQSTRYQNLVEFFKNEDTEKVQSITINTGFIPKDNEYYIDLIIRSGMAWLTTNATENVVELVPQTKQLTNVDSDQELYAYDLNFKINRTHDFQNYS